MSMREKKYISDYLQSARTSVSLSKDTHHSWITDLKCEQELKQPVFGSLRCPDRAAWRSFYLMEKHWNMFTCAQSVTDWSKSGRSLSTASRPLGRVEHPYYQSLIIYLVNMEILCISSSFHSINSLWLRYFQHKAFSPPWSCKGSTHWQDLTILSVPDSNLVF